MTAPTSRTPRAICLKQLTVVCYLIHTTLGDTDMARGTSSRSSAYGTPSSLTSLLTPNKKPWLYPTTYINPAREEPYVTISYPSTYSVEDRRTHNPNRNLTSPSSLIRSATRLAGLSPRLVGAFQHTRKREPLFSQPDAVAICIRRKVRREIIHAFNLRTKGAKSGHRRRHLFSNVGC
ncbi:MAG: hypothetical protein [Arizlama microvirus]|nr:MAG: hypothetical protein [Arizlama microvirus]